MSTKNLQYLLTKGDVNTVEVSEDGGKLKLLNFSTEQRLSSMKLYKVYGLKFSNTNDIFLCEEK